MKSHSDVRPPIFQDLGDGSWYYNYNIKDAPRIEENGEEKPGFEYETVHVWGYPTKASLKKAIIRSLVGESEEFALVNAYNKHVLGVKVDEEAVNNYSRYLQYTEDLSAMLDKDFSTLNG